MTPTTITFTATDNTITARAAFRTREEADEVAALFPKSAKVRVTTCATYTSYWSTSLGDPIYIRGSYEDLAPEGSGPNTHFTVYQIYFTVDLRSTGVTGSRNEGGLKRWASFKRAAAKHGLVLDYKAAYTNSLSAEDAAAL